jgi:outer membrane lipoprotein carrier protein
LELLKILQDWTGFHQGPFGSSPMISSPRALQRGPLVKPWEILFTLKLGFWRRGSSLAERPSICYKSRMLRNTLFILLSVSLSFVAQAAPNKTLKAFGKNYRSAKLVEMAVDKTVKSELLGKETKYSGKIFMANGKFRGENTTPEETLLVFDGTTIWSVQTPPKEFGGPVQVGKGKVDKKTRSQLLISTLLGEDLEKSFKVLKEEKVGADSKIEIEPKGDGLTVKTLSLLIDTKKSELKELSYKDDIGNLTTISFSKIQFKQKANNKLFKYQPPKDAQVTNL